MTCRSFAISRRSDIAAAVRSGSRFASVSSRMSGHTAVSGSASLHTASRTARYMRSSVPALRYAVSTATEAPFSLTLTLKSRLISRPSYFPPVMREKYSAASLPSAGENLLCISASASLSVSTARLIASYSALISRYSSCISMSLEPMTSGSPTAAAAPLSSFKRADMLSQSWLSAASCLPIYAAVLSPSAKSRMLSVSLSVFSRRLVSSRKRCSALSLLFSALRQSESFSV